MAKKTFIDLFSGCGGFSLGASNAGYENILSIDIDAMLTSSYRRNFPKSNLVLTDLSKLDNITALLPDPKIKPDLLIGGPPCQGFSFIGKRNEDDPRNQLIYHFFRHVKKASPNTFILENVSGLASGYGLQIVAEGIAQLPSYYHVTETIQVNAKDFGAATSRPRVLIIGCDTRYVSPSDFQQILLQDNSNITVRDAIADLPIPTKNEGEDFDWAKYRVNDNVSEYAAKLRRKPKKGLGWPIAVSKLEEGLVSGLASTEHTPEVKERFRRTLQGDNEPISRFFKLKWDLPSRTIRAGTGSDKGGFQSARPIHPSQARVITVREAARIQGFPDWFVFHPTKWHSFRMIGNSVSPIMAAKLISKIQG